MMDFTTAISEWGLSSDAIAIILAVVIIFKFFKEIIFKLVDRFEHITQEMTAESRENRNILNATLHRIEKILDKRYSSANRKILDKHYDKDKS